MKSQDRRPDVGARVCGWNGTLVLAEPCGLALHASFECHYFTVVSRRVQRRGRGWGPGELDTLPDGLEAMQRCVDCIVDSF